MDCASSQPRVRGSLALLRNHLSIEWEEADREQALVLDHVIEEDLQAGAFGVTDGASDGMRWSPGCRVRVGGRTSAA